MGRRPVDFPYPNLPWADRVRFLDDPNEAGKLACSSLLITRGRIIVHHIILEADEEYRSEIAPFTGATARIVIR